ncbi:proliferation marker protein Ki-67 isoform 2-T3 [Odontesthes bonariensis]|uniref:proliferation marker protein Ki-67 isoform X2 n=1 Tax=Odontesthes bonariensis TaxID=219752 RepID=UPI003F580E78
MPLHGKIVVIKRSGGDGTEFPLTATCVFGRRPDCDIRIQLPHVSKEHCRIDLNENKEVILTNLSSSNPTRVNGKDLQQAERLKHGDVITIIDRSFRFEYPPAPTPKKRSSIGGKAETLKVRQDQHVSDTRIAEKGEKRLSEVSTDPHLKDGANHDNIQRSLEKTLELESKDDGGQLQSKTNSPFGDLYQMIKKSLDVKTPRKLSVSMVQTPSSRFCTPKPASVRKKNDEKPVAPKKDEAAVVAGPEGKVSGTPPSVKKQGQLFKVPSADGSRAEEAGRANKSEATSPRRRNGATPQKFGACEVIGQIAAQKPKSPQRRRSKEAPPAKPAAAEEQGEEAKTSPNIETPRRSSPRNSGKAEKESKKRKSGELGADVPTQPMKRKRVSFGGQLSPELFDKRLPPDSPLRKGAAPRRSLSLFKSRQSLLRRASVIGLVKEQSPAKRKTPSPKKTPRARSASPKTPTGNKLPKSKSPSPKAASPGKRSPKTASPASKSPKSGSASPKAATPTENSPKSRSPSPAKGRSPSTSKVETPKVDKQPKTPDHTASKVARIDKRRSSLGSSSPASVKNASPIGVTPAKTPEDSGVQTPTVQGRFSVSRISTPSPAAEAGAIADQEPLLAVTPKVPLKRKSMKSASRKTPSVAKSAVKLLQRRSGISRASMRVLNSWADIVKFGQTKAPVVAPTKKTVAQKTTKKAVSKPQTPARKLKGIVSTGHADSPVTIVVGRAHKRVANPIGAAPRVVTNTALFPQNMKMDEDLTGISEMFKTPANERRRGRSFISEGSATQTPAGGQGSCVIEPSVLNTPEEPGEMMVSPLSVASTVKSRKYNSEAVQRLLDGDQESSFTDDTPALEVQSESPGQQRTDLKTTSVSTPEQKPDPPECLPGVKRSPRQKAEPLEDLRGKILKTPKQKAEQPECLTGVKRIMKTPRQKAEPLEDIRGKLLKTPKQKSEQQECLTGVKRLFKTPKQKVEHLEDLRGKLLKTPKPKEVGDVSLDGVQELLQTPTPVPKSDSQSEITDVKTPLAKESQAVCLAGVVGKMKTPEDKSSPVEDVVGAKRLAKTPKQKSEPVEENFGLKRLMKSPRPMGCPPVEDFEGLQELMEEPPTDPSGQLEPSKNEDLMMMECGVQETKDANEGAETVSAIQQQEPEVDAGGEISPSVEASATDGSPQKKSVRGRRAKATEAVDKTEAPEPSEVIAAPVRGRRAKKTEAAAPPAVRHRTRGGNPDTPENQDVEPTVEEGAPQPSEVALKPKRGRNAKKVQEVATEAEMTPEPESEQSQSADVEHKANEAPAPPEKAELKPRRGRKAKLPEQQQTEDVPPADIQKDASKAGSEPPGGVDENQSEAVATVVQATETENLPDTETTACKVTETAVVQKKPARGRRAKLVEPKEDEDQHEAAACANEPVVPAPVRARRGRKMEAAAPPAVKQMTRTRNAKSDHSAVETQMITEISTEVASSPAPLMDTIQENNDSVTPEEEVVPKPLRGRKTKPTPSETENVEQEQPVPPAAGKPKRGRKAKPDAVEPDEVAEDTVVNVETKQPSQPPVRAKRGRNAKQEEDKTPSLEAPNSQEPAQKLRRTRKTERDPVEPKEDVQTIEMAAPEKAETPLANVKTTEQASVATKPRRGGRKAKPDAESVSPVESTELKEVGSTDQPKRGRRETTVTEEAADAENPELEQQLGEEKNAEPCIQVLKSSRAKGVKTKAKAEVSQAIPAKRSRRGAAPPLEESSEESAVLASESTPGPVEPAKRGRRGAAKPSADEAQDTANQAEDSSKASVDDPKVSKRSVKWKLDLEVFDVPKATPVKAARGRKSKAASQVDTESKTMSKDANQTEEDDLSAEVAEAQPVKRGRRGAKVADVTSKGGPKEVEAEPQPKTRRGRSAKK